jgi:hypothetical protein
MKLPTEEQHTVGKMNGTAITKLYPEGQLVPVPFLAPVVFPPLQTRI